MQSDAEGRVLRLDFGNITLVNAYFPSGTSGELRQTYKYQWLNEFMEYLETLRKERPNLVITGDYNIAHREIDIHDPVGNKKSSGFYPRKEPGWINFFHLAISTVSGTCILIHRRVIRGGASDSQQYDSRIKAGVSITFALHKAWLTRSLAQRFTQM